MNPGDAIGQPFGNFGELIRAWSRRRPDHPALVHDGRRVSYAALDAMMDRVAVALQRDGIRPAESVAICAAASLEYAAVFLGAIRAGVAVAPLAPSATARTLADMVANAEARLLFADAAVTRQLAAPGPAIAARRVALDESAGGEAFSRWIAAAGARPSGVDIRPDSPFNIIYSSGTTGAPKGIVQPHRMRWSHLQRARGYGCGPDAVTLTATPLYSNTTLVSFLPTLALGGTVVLMSKFDAATYLELAERHRATDTMLVPVQYQRLLAHPDFGTRDLSGFRMKFCASAPFPAALKAEVLGRWPGGLIEYYGMTEGGGSCILLAHRHPDKLGTVGQPAAGHDIRLIDDAGREVARGEIGEVVGHSPAMMSGYHRQPEKTREAEWYAPDGKRFIRTGDLAQFDDDGFLTLMDRKKDMIISGGFNIFPSDLEAVLTGHPAVADAAVVGVPSQRWGETPVAFVALRPGAAQTALQIRDWTNRQVGKTQRLAALRIVDELPRNAIGKVLKRELRETFVAAPDA